MECLGKLNKFPVQDCIGKLNKVVGIGKRITGICDDIDDIVTKCDDSDDEKQIYLEQIKVPQIDKVRNEYTGFITDEVIPNSDNDDIKDYYCVLAFPTNMKFKLKIKNKIKSATYENFTNAQQSVIFKRHIKDWASEICRGKYSVIPEYTEKGNLHFNIIFRANSSQTIKDMKLTFTDAYNVKYEYKNIFCNIQPITDKERLLDIYLKKKEGKEYQYTGIVWEFENIL